MQIYYFLWLEELLMEYGNDDFVLILIGLWRWKGEWTE